MARFRRSAKGKIARKKAQLARALRNRELVRQCRDKPCHDCGGIFDPICMEFHHVHGNKRFNVSRTYRVSKKTLQEEIDKCVVICANCHKLRHKTLG